ncbi:MAG: helix-turn-helix domain-containing protein [Raineya sp.]|jgi:transcriptional regulator with XRE-family HTH domain|nr:helix-turn-helix domain-containing protein [Raineya sp.]
MTTLGTKLRKFRTVAKLSQQEIADKLNIRQATYSNWEKGETKPSLDHIIKLSEVFNVPVQEFLPTSNVYIHNQENNDNAMGINFGLDDKDLQKILEPIHLLIQQNNSQNEIIKNLLEQNKELIELLKNKK